VQTSHYVTADLSSFMRPSYSETFGEIHISVSIPHDTQRGIAVDSTCLHTVIKKCFLCQTNMYTTLWTLRLGHDFLWGFYVHSV